MANLKNGDVELGLTSEFTAVAERERERLEGERANADHRLTEARTALNLAITRQQALERLLSDDPEEWGHGAELVAAAQQERERWDDVLTAAEQQVAEEQAARDQLTSQIGVLNRLLADGSEDLDAPDAPRADANAVIEVLVDRGKPMHYRDIYAALAGVGFKVGGEDPASTLLARFYDDPRLVRVARGTYVVEVPDYWFGGDSDDSAAPPLIHNLLERAAQVLRASGKPLHYREIAREMATIDQRIYDEGIGDPGPQVSSKAPDETCLWIAQDIRWHGDRSKFRRVGPVGYGTYERA